MPGKQLYYNNPTVFDLDTEESFYWAGFIAADGCVMEKGRSYPFVFKVSLSNKDILHIHKLKDFLKCTNPIKILTTNHSDKQYCELIVYSKYLCFSLARFGITPRKSLTYNIPQKIVNHALFKHFIRGYIDGDGSPGFGKSYNDKSKQFGTNIRGTINCLTSINNILTNELSLNKERSIGLADNIGTVSYCGNKISKKICNFIYNDNTATIYLDRKYELYLQLLKINEKIDKYLQNKYPSFTLTKEQVENAIKNNKFAKDACAELNIGGYTLQRLAAKFDIIYRFKRKPYKISKAIEELYIK